MPHRSTTVLCGALLLAAGCTTVSPSADHAPAARPFGAAALRAAAVTARDLGPGYTVTVMDPDPDGTGRGAREVADLPVCQPVLDALAPDKGPSGPLAETDLSVVPAARPQAAVYAGLLAFAPGRAERARAGLDALLARCGVFRSAPGAAGGAPAGAGAPGVYRLARVAAPVPAGADAATGFTLTAESGGVVIGRRALAVTVGAALVVFSTVAAGPGPAPVPDERVVRAQTPTRAGPWRFSGRPPPRSAG